MEINNSVAAWSAGLAAQRLPRWDELPDIDLYLDQVLTLLDKYPVSYTHLTRPTN